MDTSARYTKQPNKTHGFAMLKLLKTPGGLTTPFPLPRCASKKRFHDWVSERSCFNTPPKLPRAFNPHGVFPPWSAKPNHSETPPQRKIGPWSSSERSMASAFAPQRFRDGSFGVGNLWKTSFELLVGTLGSKRIPLFWGRIQQKTNNCKSCFRTWLAIAASYYNALLRFVGQWR